ncbi:tonsoku-like protein [Strigops habroptila]|uniref:tonsoku-like protein n=1 Tax=Strigops habroptila TaxID=2489341 RepID=UPI0014030BD2|nr:tonsoku-like protein [Strigops habroptila]
MTWKPPQRAGRDPLHRACIEGDLRRVRLLLQQGHPVNPRDYCGWTPLHEACNHGHLEIVRERWRRGGAGRPGGPGCDGVTPLHDALSCGHFEVAQLLLQHGASVSARDSRGLTPLGTLEQWVSTYREELDQETRERARDTERLLRDAAAARASPRPCQDPELFDAETSQQRDREPERAGSVSPLRPVKKRHRAMEPDGCEAANRASRRPALIPEEQYLQEQQWLEDDLGMARGGRKRPRRERRERRDLDVALGDTSRMEKDDGGDPRRRRRSAPRDRIPPERRGSGGTGARS